MHTIIYDQVNMKSLITTHTFQHVWQVKIYKSKMILLLMSLKHFWVSYEIIIRLVFPLFIQSHYIISYLLFSSKYTRWKMSDYFLMALLWYNLHAYLFNLCAEKSVISFDSNYILISNTEVKEFQHYSMLNVIWTDRMRTCYLLHSLCRHASLSTNLWIDQCTVCSTLNLDTCTI